MLTVTSPPILMLVYIDRHISPILMLVYVDRHISPFEGGRGDVLKVFVYVDHRISPVLMLVYADLRISPVLMLVYVDRRISPFEGSPRAGAAEYVHRGDV